MKVDAVVVGAGIVGCACARALSREGIKVAVIDPLGVGDGTTAAGMGHVVVMDDSPAQWAITKYSRDLWNQLAPNLAPACEYVNSGTFWVAADEEEMAHVRSKREEHVAHGVRAEILDSHSLAEAEPALASGMAGALLVPDDGVLYNPAAAAWLLEDSGAEKRFGRKVARITSAGVELVDGEKVDCGIVVNAAGFSADRLTPKVQIKPRKGHLLITDRYPGLVRHQIVELGYLKSAHGTTADSVAFNVQPRATGQLMIGSSRQYGATRTDIEPAMLRKMLARAFEYMPALRDLKIVRAWAGMRPATPDKLPVIGPLPDSPNVFVAAGHEGLGITTSLATGQMIADMATKRPTAIDPRPYLPDRLYA